MAFTAQTSLHLYETAQIIHLVTWNYPVSTVAVMQATLLHCTSILMLCIIKDDDIFSIVFSHVILPNSLVNL